MSHALPASMILMGKVLRPHGLAGLLRIRFYGRSERSFPRAGTVFLDLDSGERHACRVTSVRAHKNILLMKLEGVDTCDQAERYRGARLLIGKDALTREDEDEYFWHELLGLKVFLDTGEYLGILSQIVPTGSNDIYVVKEGDKERLIPATVEVIREIDPDAGKMVISPMEGLLDLNEI